MLIGREIPGGPNIHTGKVCDPNRGGVLGLLCPLEPQDVGVLLLTDTPYRVGLEKGIIH